MKKTPKASKPLTAEAIAKMADKGQDVTRFFTGKGRMMAGGAAPTRLEQSIQRVNVDLTVGMLQELDQAAGDLNISRQALIKMLVRQALDQHYLASQARTRSR